MTKLWAKNGGSLSCEFLSNRNSISSVSEHLLFPPAPAPTGSSSFRAASWKLSWPHTLLSPCHPLRLSQLSPVLLPIWTPSLHASFLCSLPVGPPKDTSLCFLLHTTGIYSFSRTWGSSTKPDTVCKIHLTSLLVSWARKMAQQIKALATKPDDGSSIPRGTRDRRRQPLPVSCPLPATRVLCDYVTFPTTHAE